MVTYILQNCWEGSQLGMGIATKNRIAIYCDKWGRIAIRITIYWDSVKSKNKQGSQQFNMFNVEIYR